MDTLHSLVQTTATAPDHTADTAAPAIPVAAQGSGAAPLTDTQIQAMRQKNLNEILTGSDGTVVARYIRLSCTDADKVASIAKDRISRPDLPDAADGCVAALRRDAQDGNLYRLYADLLERHEQPRSEASSLPQKVIDAIHNGSNKVDLGGGQTLPVTSGLAFDAGFTGAWLNQGANSPGEITDPVKFRDATEKCFSQKGNDKSCFVMGFVQGARQYLDSRRAAER